MRISRAQWGRLIGFARSVPISLRTGIRAVICGDSKRRDRFDVASHPRQQLTMSVHGCADFAATGPSTALAELVLVAQREWVLARELAVLVSSQLLVA